MLLCYLNGDGDLQLKKSHYGKKIVCSCNDWDMNRPVLDQISVNCGGVWGAICNIWKINKKVESIVKNGLWVMVGKPSPGKINGSGMTVS